MAKRTRILIERTLTVENHTVWPDDYEDLSLAEAIELEQNVDMQDFLDDAYSITHHKTVLITNEISE